MGGTATREHGGGHHVNREVTRRATATARSALATAAAALVLETGDAS